MLYVPCTVHIRHIASLSFSLPFTHVRCSLSLSLSLPSSSFSSLTYSHTRGTHSISTHILYLCVCECDPKITVYFYLWSDRRAGWNCLYVCNVYCMSQSVRSHHWKFIRIDNILVRTSLHLSHQLMWWPYFMSNVVPIKQTNKQALNAQRTRRT